MEFLVGAKNNQKTITIELPEKPSTIGVMVSGGCDSAILLYILAWLNKKENNKHTIITFTVPRTDGAYLYSPDIVKYINQELDINLNIPYQVGDPGVHHSQQVRSGHWEAAEKFNLDLVYYGSQSVPPEEFPMPGIYPKRPSSIVIGNTRCPFALVDKRHTLDLYNKFNQFELLKLTHSCTEQQVGRCKQCFNCVERQWACEQLGIIDPGVK